MKCTDDTAHLRLLADYCVSFNYLSLVVLPQYLIIWPIHGINSFTWSELKARGWDGVSTSHKGVRRLAESQLTASNGLIANHWATKILTVILWICANLQSWVESEGCVRTACHKQVSMKRVRCYSVGGTLVWQEGQGHRVVHLYLTQVVD